MIKRVFNDNPLNEKYQKFLETEFTVFDIETSGLNPASDDILEIAGIKLKGKDELERFEALIQPSRAIPPEVERIHGLNEIFLLANGQNNKKVMSDFLNFVGESIIVGHNIREFDWLFVLHHMQRHNLTKPENKMIDTLELSRKLLPLSRHNLGEVSRHFGHEIKNAHRAMPDVEGNVVVFLELMEKLLNGK